MSFLLVPSTIVTSFFLFFFFYDTATTQIYTLSLHDALPIFSRSRSCSSSWGPHRAPAGSTASSSQPVHGEGSEEQTSELQSRQYFVCRLLLEKKKQEKHTLPTHVDNLVSQHA